ncbi:MAG: TonB-dependent receptor, partial [Bacteroidales bacterium]|nr:TonB-dependent receptor [Bacteroidales bacterium]
MKKIFFILIITLLPLFAAAQNGTIKGFVYNLSDGEPIIFANIIIDKTTIGTSTNELGFFVLNKLPKGQYTLKIQSLGFADTTIRVNLEAEKTLNIKIELQPQAKMLENVEISAEQEIAKTEARVSVKKITATDIQKIPSIGGQADIAQYIQVLPGVVFSGDQGGQLYIRGGSAIQNKVLLDGMIIYNPFHSIGLFSVFETDVIRNADVYTGGFNAKYGGRLSSVMDITTRDGNKKQTSGKLSLSTFGGSAIIEGPIVKENEQRDYSVSYLLTAKNSYLSKTSGSIYNYIDTELPYDFFDIYGKMTLASKTGSKLNVFGFNFTDDVKGYKNIADFSWQNTGIGANILLVPQNSQSIVQAMTAYSKY